MSYRPRFPLPRPPSLPPRPLDLLFGPSISKMSFLLSFNVPPLNFPTPGAPTPRSLFPSLLFFIFAFSKMMPFSLASLLLFPSFSVCLAMIPLLCDMGIFSCFIIDVFDPNACNLRSVALCRLLPLSVGFFEDSRRCDSARSRCKARSFFRFAASDGSSSSVVSGFPRSREVSMVVLGGLEVCKV